MNFDNRLLYVNGAGRMMWPGDTIWYSADHTHGHVADIAIHKVFEVSGNMMVQFIDTGNYDVRPDEKQIFDAETFQEYITILSGESNMTMEYYDGISTYEKMKIMDACDKLKRTIAAKKRPIIINRKSRGERRRERINFYNTRRTNG